MSTVIKATTDKILGRMANPPSGTKTLASGIIIQDKDMEVSGISPRWFEIVSVGPECDLVEAGQYVLVEHGRWSNKLVIGFEEYIWLIDNEKLLLVCDENPLHREDEWDLV